jgi:hypothetical protein
MMLPALLLIVNGTVTNETTGKPAAGATVTLYKLGSAGPESIETVKAAADGGFEINQTPQAGPHMVQVAFDGVTYNHMLFPGRPVTGISVPVYQSSQTRGSAKVATHMVLIESNGSELSVSESYVWSNEGKTSFYDPAAGAFRFMLPKGAEGKVRVMCTHPGSTGMPIERAAEKTNTAGVYKVDFPVKPGETRFDLDYRVAGTALVAKNLYPEAPVNFVVPQGITLAGDGVKELGQHPESQALIYRVEKPAFELMVQGSGSLRADSASGGEEEGAGLQQIRPRVYERFALILGLTAVILFSGLLLLYRKGMHAVVALPDKRKP